MKTSLLNLQILFFACIVSLQLQAQILPYKDSNQGFQKVFLQPNEEKELIFRLGQQELQEYMGNNEWKFQPGKYRIMFGSSSREIQQEFLWEYFPN